MKSYAITEGPAGILIALSVMNAETVPFRLNGLATGFDFLAMVTNVTKAESRKRNDHKALSLMRADYGQEYEDAEGQGIFLEGKGWPDGPRAPETEPGILTFVAVYDTTLRRGVIHF